MRTAGTGRAGPDRLREAARAGAPPCSVAAAIFEACFVREGPWSHGVWEDGTPVALLDDYRPLGDRWALRLERACRLHDRQTGELGSGLLWLIDDVLGWEPSHGAPRGARRDVVDLTGGRPTRHQDDPGFPGSLAYFVARLVVHARALRRSSSSRRRAASIDWHSWARPPGPDPHRSAREQAFWESYYRDLEDLEPRNPE